MLAVFHSNFFAYEMRVAGSYARLILARRTMNTSK